MSRVDRFSVSLDTELLAAFDGFIADRGYSNRSEAVRDMIRDWLSSKPTGQGQAVVVGAMTAVCDHSIGPLATRLRAMLCDDVDVIAGISSVPLTADRELIAITFRGPGDRVEQVAGRIGALRGIAHAHWRLFPAGDA